MSLFALLPNKKSPRRPLGLSLIELTIVLAISSLLVAGSLAWFDSKKGTDFYDQMRQVESVIRESQTEITSNFLPGYDDTCELKAKSTCPLKANDQIFATGVNMSTSDANSKKSIVRAYYKAILDPLTKKIKVTPPNNIAPYKTTTYNMPTGVEFVGYKQYDAACATSYTNVPRDNSDTAIRTGSSIVTTRREPNVMNHFLTNAGGSYYALDLGGWGGDDPFSSITPTTQPVQTIPCAVVWLFESIERRAGAPLQPRFNAQIVFDLRNRTTRLQTNK